MDLRPYQRDALKTIDHDLKLNDDPVLLQASCGAGKTVIICKLIERYFNTTDRTFLILAHKQELISQAYNSFEKFTNIPKSEIGVVCAGLGNFHLVGGGWADDGYVNHKKNEVLK